MSNRTSEILIIAVIVLAFFSGYTAYKNTQQYFADKQASFLQQGSIGTIRNIANRVWLDEDVEFAIDLCLKASEDGTECLEPVNQAVVCSAPVKEDTNVE